MDAATLARGAALLYAGLVSDACDRVGLRQQVVDPGIRPIWQGAAICGRVRTQLARATGWMPVAPYARQMEAIDSLEPQDVAVAVIAGDPSSGFWGELFSTAGRARGAVGAVIDGCVRDAVKLESMAFPVFARGHHPADSLGRLEVVSFDEPIVIGGVEAVTGDVVFADVDGIVVVPQERADEVLSQAFEKAIREDTVREELAAGVTLAEVWRRHRVL